ncbi:MAG: hypothetical protein M3N51_00925, partial [Actinomycetota bacterium]|nr:hypothetical protein [Actinomycetota bacterium]
MTMATSCSHAEGSTTRYKDPEERFILELPADWHLYPEGLDQLESRPFNASQRVSGVAFDGYPGPDPEHLSVPVSESQYPVGTAAVRSIGERERDFVSRYLLTQTVLPYEEEADYREMLKQDFALGEDVEGVRVLVQYRETATNDLAAVFLQSVTNADDTQMYSIAVGCSVECFQAHEVEIAEVVTSWKVNTRE